MIDKIPAGNSFSVKGRIWLETVKGPFLGYGRVELLRKIKEYGSISQAAKSMGIAYRHAWHLIDSMNSKAETPLVTTQSGGKGGGGAVVTQFGEKAISEFDDLERRFRKFLESESNKFQI